MSVSPSNSQAQHRAVRARLRALERARVRKLKNTKRRRAESIREELAKPRARECRCVITPQSTNEELRELGAGCTAGRWVCPTLDAIRRRLTS